MQKIEPATRAFIMQEGRKVAMHRKFGFYRWMLNIVKSGYDHHGRNA